VTEFDEFLHPHLAVPSNVIKLMWTATIRDAHTASIVYATRIERRETEALLSSWEKSC
jgi:hypothetical protein